MADDNDSLDFNLGEGSSSDTKTATAVIPVNPLGAVNKTETGGASISVIHDPMRKGQGMPNEDAMGAKNVTIAAGSDPGELLKRVIGNIASTHQTRDDGTTVAANLVTQDTLYTATMGDSPVFVISYDPSADPSGKPVTLTQVNIDHVASNEDERSKLPDPSLARASGSGRWRVYNEDNDRLGIMLTRAVGDRDFKLNQEVDIKTYDLAADAKAGKIDFVVAASDGAMEGTNVQDIEAMLNKMFKDSLSSVGQIPSADEIAYHMATHRYDSHTMSVEPYRRNDDTSVVVQPVSELQQQTTLAGGKQQAKLITAADGHGFKYDIDLDDNIVPKYEKLLSQTVVEETERYVQNPNLMRESTIRRA